MSKGKKNLPQQCECISMDVTIKSVGYPLSQDYKNEILLKHVIPNKIVELVGKKNLDRAFKLTKLQAVETNYKESDGSYEVLLALPSPEMTEREIHLFKDFIGTSVHMAKILNDYKDLNLEFARRFGFITPSESNEPTSEQCLEGDCEHACTDAKEEAETTTEIEAEDDNGKETVDTIEETTEIANNALLEDVGNIVDAQAEALGLDVSEREKSSFPLFIRRENYDENIAFCHMLKKEGDERYGVILRKKISPETTREEHDRFITVHSYLESTFNSNRMLISKLLAHDNNVICVSGDKEKMMTIASQLNLRGCDTIVIDFLTNNNEVSHK